MTRFAGRLSGVATINASVIQGSGFGPAAFAINASDLHPVHDHNRIVKFADDTYLIIPASKRDTIGEELASISAWATKNNLKLNPTKSKEMIVMRRSRRADLPPPYPGIERVDSLVVLGVTISRHLRASLHIDRLLGTCTSSLHALRVLRAHGLPQEALYGVTRATIISRLLYAAPAWWGLASAGDRNRLERFFAKMKRLDYLPSSQEPIEALVDTAERRLLGAVISNYSHVLRSLFPPIVHRQYNLRPRSHNFKLPEKDDKNFIPRILYKL